MKILVFDTETTGLYNKAERDLEKQPYIVQIAAIYGRLEDWQFIEEWRLDELYKPPISIPYETSLIHHIYDVDVKDKAPIDEGIIGFCSLTSEVDIVIWHNIEFDISMLQCEISRLKQRGVNIDFTPKKTFCTMNESINWCRLPRKSWNWFKRPKLQELTKLALWQNFYWAHNAIVDVEWTLKAFIKLWNDWVFNPKEREQQWLFD